MNHLFREVWFQWTTQITILVNKKLSHRMFEEKNWIGIIGCSGCIIAHALLQLIGYVDLGILILFFCYVADEHD